MLLMIALVFVIAVLFKDRIITTSLLSNNKDFLDALSKLATLFALLIGGVLSYLRFFKGRTFRPKLILKPQSGIIRVDDTLLHWLEIEIQNTGSVSIWNYKIKIYATFHGSGTSNQEVTEFVSLPSQLQAEEHLVDVAESGFEHAFISVPMDVKAVTYQIVLIDQYNTAWTRCLTVKNSALK
jgi:hypothetical protein